MESTKFETLYIPNGVNELFEDRLSLEKGGEEWQDLEQFWGKEKHRLQDVDGQVKPLSSSLEEHLLNDSFLNEPQRKSTLKDEDELPFELVTVRGEDIKDIPSSYTIGGFKPQEHVVIGTYVDKEIIPGFRYKVRKNLTDEYLFEGKAKYLENVGLGYGKRIIFEGDSLNENENFFWSDSRIHGYGFSLQTIRDEDVFNIVDTKTGQNIGRVLVNNPALKDDEVISTTVREKGNVEKEVEVQFTCDVILRDYSNNQNIFIEEIPVRGKAIVVRENMYSKAKINHIILDDFVLDACLLLPEEYIIQQE